MPRRKTSSPETALDTLIELCLKRGSAALAIREIGDALQRALSYRQYSEQDGWMFWRYGSRNRKLVAVLWKRSRIHGVRNPECSKGCPNWHYAASFKRRREQGGGNQVRTDAARIDFA